MQEYDWPGNVRELRNVIERAVILARGGPLHFDLSVTDPAASAPPLSARHPENNSETSFLTEAQMQRRERENLLVVLETAGWKVKGADGAAERMGLNPTTLLSRMKKMGLKKPA